MTTTEKTAISAIVHKGESYLHAKELVLFISKNADKCESHEAKLVLKKLILALVKRRKVEKTAKKSK